MRRSCSLLCAVLVFPALSIATPAEDARVKGYAEYRSAGAIVVEGQVVRAFAGTRLEGAAARGLDAIPLGYEVDARGERQADGTILAREVEAKANGDAMFESEVLAATNEIETIWVREGRMFDPDESGAGEDIGRLADGGAHAERVRRITRRLVPPYVDFDEHVRVHVVETDEWNAAAMGNGSIWVYTGLIDSMSDDELAVVLGHEIAHYTHEHSRRQAKASMWQGLAGLGAIIVGEAIGTDVSRTVAGLSAAIGLTVWGSGYSRDHEDQADRVGLRYAYEGGFDVVAGVSLWQKFRTKYGEADKVTNFFFGSHSRPSDRVRNIEREIHINYRDRVGALANVVVDFPETTPESTAESGNEWVAQVNAQLDGFREQRPAGYETAVGPLLEQLEPGDAADLVLDVRAGSSYLVLAVCDADCDDLDLVLFDSRGRQVAADLEPDDYPVVTFEATATGRMTVQVRMAACDADTCVYGIEVYARR